MELEETMNGNIIENLGIVIDSSIGNFANVGEYENYGGVQFGGGNNQQIFDEITIKTTFENINLTGDVSYPLNSDMDSILYFAKQKLNFDLNGAACILISFTDKPDDWMYEGETINSLPYESISSIKIFQKFTIATVYTLHEEPKIHSFDILKNVKDHTTDLLEEFGFTNTIGYGLFKIKDNDTIYLDPSKKLVDVAQNEAQLFFGRKYFVFSGIDLYTVANAKRAFKDAVIKFIQDDQRITEDDALEICALQCFGLDDPCYHPPGFRFDDDISFMLPPSYGGAIYLGEALNEYIAEYDEIDQFNACRRGIQFIRSRPHFAVEKFKLKVILVHERHRIDQEVTAEVGPLSITLFTGKEAQERISISKILNVEILEKSVAIQFSVNKTTSARYEFIGKDIKKFATAVDSIVGVVRLHLVEQANIRTLALMKNPDTNEEDRLILKTTSNIKDQNPREFIYNSKFTGAMLQHFAENNLGMEHSDSNALLIKFNERYSRWIQKDDLIGILSIQDGMVLYVLNSIQLIKVTMVDGSTRTLKLTITKNIEDLCQEVFEQTGQPNLPGFTFFVPKENGESDPLDVRFSIPEQTESFDSLIFKRRFFYITSEALDSPLSARMAVHDCRELIQSEKCKVDTDTALNLAALGALATVFDKITDVKTITNFDFLKDFLPKSMSVSSKIIDRFKEILKGIIPLEKHRAARRYLGKVRKLKGFGEETFIVVFQDVGTTPRPRPRKNIEMNIGPLYLIFYDPSAKEIMYKIGYRFIMNYEVYGRMLMLKFIGDKKGTVVSGQISVPDIDKVMMFLSFNIKILQDITTARLLRQKKEMQEITDRLRGGYVDEAGISHKAMIDFFITDTMNFSREPKKMWLGLEFRPKDIIDAVQYTLGLKSDIEYSVLLKVVDRVFHWIKPDQQLFDLIPFRGSLMAILPRYADITYTLNNIKREPVRVDITMPVSDIVLELCKQSKIEEEDYSLFGLYYTTDKGQYPLAPDQSIPEQLTVYEGLVLRPRLYSERLSKSSDQEKKLSIALAYHNDLISERIKINDQKKIYQMAMLSYIITTNTASPSLSAIPDQGKGYVPISMENPKAPQKMIESLKSLKVESVQEACTKYLNYFEDQSLSIDGFDVDTVPETRDKILKLTENGVRLCSGSSETTIAFYVNIVNVTFCDTMLCIKHYKINELKSTILYTDHAETIANFIRESIMRTRKDILFSINQENYESNKFKANIFYNLNEYNGCHEINTCDKVESILNIIDKPQVSTERKLLIKYEENESRWIKPDTYLAEYPLGNGVRIDVIESVITIKVKYGEEVQRIYIDPSTPVGDLIQIIASHFYIEFWNGYSIYIEGPEEETPLNLSLSLAEQINTTDNLIFKRRFFIFTRFDYRSLALTSDVFRDAYEHIMSGIPKLNELKALELAIYAIFARAETPEDALRTEIPDDITGMIPSSVKIGPRTRTRLANLLVTSPPISKAAAIRKYLLIARSLNSFGCEYAHGIFIPKDNTHTMKNVTLSFSPFGIHIFGGDRKKDIAKIGYRNVLYYRVVDDNIMLRVSEESGSLYSFYLKSNDCKLITDIIDSYRNYILPVLMKREQVQALISGDPIFSLIRGIEGNEVKLYISTALGYPEKQLCSFAMNWNFDTLQMMCKFYLGDYSEDTKIIIYRRPNATTAIINSDMFLSSVFPEEEGTLIICNPTNISEITKPGRSTITQEITAYEPAMNYIYLAAEKLRLGVPFGHTFYDEYGPLDFMMPIHGQASNTFALRMERRFFIVILDMYNDEQSLQQFYQDAVRYYLKNMKFLDDDTLGHLSAYVILIEENTTTQITEEVLQRFLPEGAIPNERMMLACTSKFEEIIIDKGVSKLMRYFVTMITKVQGFGAETYQGKCYNLNDRSARSMKNCRMEMDYIKILVNIEGEADFVINFCQLLTFNMNGNEIEIHYQDIDGSYISLGFIPEENFNYCYSFIADIYMLYKYLEEQHIGFVGQTIVEQYQSYEPETAIQDPLMNLHTGIIEFDDISAINTNIFISTQEGIFNWYISINSIDTTAWRFTEEGLNLLRMHVVIEYIDMLLSSITYEQYEEEKYKFEFYTAALANINVIAEVSDVCTNISTLIQSQNQEELTTNTYSYQSASKDAEKALVNLAKKLDKKTKPFPPVNPSMEAIAFSLIQLSDFMEKTICTTAEAFPLLDKVVFDHKLMIDNMRTASLEFTKIAEYVMNSKDLIKMKKDITERFIALAGVLHTANEIIKAAKEKEILLPEFEKSIITSLKMHQGILDILNSFEESNDLLYVGNHQPAQIIISHIEAANECFRTYLNSKSAKGDNKIRSSIVYSFFEKAQQNLRKSLVQLDQNSMNENARSCLLYILQRSIVMANMIIDNIPDDVPTKNKGKGKNKNTANDSIKYLKESLRTVVKSATEAIQYISTINITIKSLRTIIKDVDSFSTTKSKFPDRFLKQLSESENKSYNSLINEMIKIDKNINKYEKTIKTDPIDAATVRNCQSDLISLSKTVLNFNTIARVLNEKTGDDTYSILVDTLMTDINNAITEPQCTEDPAKCYHLSAFQQVQLDTACTLASIKAVLNMNQIQQSAELLGQVKAINKQTIDSYKKQIEARALLHDRPYNAQYLEDAKKIISHSLEKSEATKTMSKYIAENTSNKDFDVVVDKMIQSMENAKNALEKAPLGLFRKPPEEKTIQLMYEDVGIVSEMIIALAPCEYISQNEELQGKLDDKLDQLENMHEEIEAQLNAPTLDFFIVAGKLQGCFKEIKEMLQPVPDYSTNEEMQRVMDDALNNMDEALQDTPPNVDLARRCTTQSLESINNVIETINHCESISDLAANATAKQSIIEMKTAFEHSAFIISEALIKNFSIGNINLSKEYLLNLEPNKVIPMNVRHALGANINELGKAVSTFSNISDITVNCIRLLPTGQLIDIDTSAIQPIPKDTDMDEMIKQTGQQITALIFVVNQLMNDGSLISRPSLHELLNKIFTLLELGKPEEFTDERNRTKILELLKNLRQGMPFIVKQAAFITSIINSEKFIDAAKITSANINTLFMLLSNPHITAKTSPEFIKVATPLCQATIVNTSTLLEMPQVRSNKKLLDSVDTLNKYLTQNTMQLASMPVKKLQGFADTLALQLTDVIPSLFMRPEFDPFLECLLEIFKMEENYTPKARSVFKYTSALLIKNQAIKDDQRTEAFKKACTIGLNPDNASLDDFNPIITALSAIQTKPGQMPFYLHNSVNLALKPMRTGRSSHAFDAARVLASCSPKSNINMKNLDILSCTVGQRAVALIQEIDNVVKDLKLKMTEQNIELNEEGNYCMGVLEAAIRTNTMPQGKKPTLAVVAGAYDNLSSINAALNLFVAFCRNDPSLVQLIDLIVHEMIEYNRAIRQLELSLVAFYMVYIDGIATCCEEIVFGDKLAKFGDILNPYLKEWLPILKNADRLKVVNAHEMYTLTGSVKMFQENDFPHVAKSMTKSKATSTITAIFSTLAALEPFIALYSKPPKKDSGATVMDVRGLISQVTNGLSISYQSLRTKPESFGFVFSQVYSVQTQLSHLVSQSEIENIEKLKAIVEEGTVMMQSVTMNTDADQAALVPYITHMNDIMKRALEAVNELSKPDYFALSLTDANLSVNAPTINAISHKPSQKAAKIAADYLKELAKEFEKTESPRKLTKKQSTASKGRRKSKSSVVSRKSMSRTVSLPDVSLNPTPVVPLSSVASNSLLTLNTQEVIKQRMNKKALEQPAIVATASCRAGKELLISSRKSSVAQRALLLMEHQASTFPDIQGMFGTEKKYKSSDIKKAFESIKEQLSKFNDSTALLSIEHSLTADEVLLQQQILASIASSSISEELDVGIGPLVEKSISSVYSKLDQMLQTAASEGQMPSIYSTEENYRTISRASSIASLSQDIRSLQLSILTNRPEMFRFCTSNDGVNLAVGTLDQTLVSDAQRAVSQELQLVRSPDFLKSYLMNIPQESLVVQLRVLKEMEAQLAGESGEKISARIGSDPSSDSIFQSLAIEQLVKVKNGHETLPNAGIIDLSTSVREQDIFLSKLDAVEMSRRLYNIQLLQKSIHKLKGMPKNGPISKPNMIKAIKSIKEQLSASGNEDKLTALIKKLKEDEVKNQQHIILQSLTILSSMPSELKEEPDMELSTIMSNIVASIEKSFIKSPEAVSNNENPLSSPIVVDSLEAMHSPLDVVDRAHNIATIISILNDILPNIADQAKNINDTKKFLNSKTLSYAQNQINDILKSLKTNPSEAKTVFQGMQKQEQALLYSLLVTELANYEESVDQAKQLSQISSELDRAAIIQIGTPIEDLITYDFNSEDIVNSMNQNHNDIVRLTAQSKLESLANSRHYANSHIPHPDPEKLLSTLVELGPNLLKEQVSKVSKQINMTPDEIKADIADLSKDVLAAQEAILAHAHLALSNGDFTSNDADVGEAVQKTIDSAFKQEMKVVEKSPEIIAAAPKIEPIKAKIILQVTRQAITKKSLAQTLNTIVQTIMNKSSDLDAYLNTPEGNEALTAEFTKAELTQGQMALKAIIAGGPNEIPLMSNKEATRLIVVAKTLIEALEEEGPVPSVAMTDRELGGKSIARLPTQREAISAIMAASAGTVRAIVKLKDTSKAAIQAKIIEEMDKALSILSKLEARPGEWSIDVHALLDMAPNLVALTARVLPTLSEDVRARVFEEPSEILTLLKTIELNSTDSSPPSGREKVRTSVRLLYSKMLNLYAAINPKPVGSPIELTSAIADAIDRKQHLVLDDLLIRMEALYTGLLTTGNKLPVLEKVEPTVEDLSSIFQKIDPTVVGTHQLKKLERGKEKLMAVVSKTSKNPFALVASTKTMEGILAALQEVKGKIADEFNTTEFQTNEERRKAKISAATSYMLHSMALVFKGVRLVGCTEVDAYQSATNLLVDAVRAVKKMNARENWTVLGIRNQQRKFERLITSSIALLGEGKVVNSEKPEKDIEKIRVKFAQELGRVCETMTTAGAAFAQTSSGEAYKALAEGAIPETKYIAHAWEKLNSELGQYEFTRSTMKMIDILESMQQTFSAQEHNAVEGTEKLYDFAMMANESIQNSKIDPKNELLASLPTRLDIPPYDPSDKDAVSKLSKLTKGIEAAINQFTSLYPKKSTKDSELCPRITKMRDALSRVLSAMMTLAASTNVIETQSKAAAACSRIQSAFMQIVQKMKMRLSGDNQDITAECAHLADAVRGITELADKVSKQREIVAATIDPITSANAQIEKLRSSVTAMPTGPVRDTLLSLVQLELSLSGGITSVLSIAGDRAIDPEKDAVCVYARRVAQHQNEMEKAIKGILGAPSKDQPKSVSDACASLGSICEEFSKQRTKSVLDVSALREAVRVLGESSKRLSEKAKESKNSSDKNTLNSIPSKDDKANTSDGRKSRKKSKVSSAQPETEDNETKKGKKSISRKQSAVQQQSMQKVQKTVSIKIQPTSMDDLMRRLVLESRVVKARHLLTRFEQKISKL